MINRLREFREKNKLSQQELADKLQALGYKISKAAISMYENGGRNPTEQKWQELATFFHTDVDTLKGKVSSVDEVAGALVAMIHESFFTRTETELKKQITMYLKLTNQIEVPYAFYPKKSIFKLNNHIYSFWKNCFEFIFQDKKFMTSLIGENDKHRLALLITDKIKQANKKMLNKTGEGRVILQLQKGTDEISNYILDNNLENILDLDKIKVVDPSGKDVTNELTISQNNSQRFLHDSIDNQIKLLKMIKNDKQ